MKIARLLSVLLLLAAPAGAQTTDNAASCDIVVAPAATLLLPYFEVDTAAAEGDGTTALFTVTNTSPQPQIAHVTIWTDWAYPVLTFNVVLTGHDVQGINLYDVVVKGKIPQTRGETARCARLPATIEEPILGPVRSALTNGAGFLGCNGLVGYSHGSLAVGYVTVDVVSDCSTMLPTDAAYYAGPEAPLRFDNVLLGDYQQIGRGDARGNTMVHIRAIPEGGRSGAEGGVPVSTNLPYTFYDRYTPARTRTADRRQPLPSTFAVRYIQGGSASAATDFKIWREGVTAGPPACASRGSLSPDATISTTSLSSMIRFDDHGNSWDIDGRLRCGECAPNPFVSPATSRVSSLAGNIPPLNSTDVAGWIYMNLSSGSQHFAAGAQVRDTSLSAQRVGFAPADLIALGSSGSRTTTQNWVIVSVSGDLGLSRLASDFDAVPMGNGCTPAPPPRAVVAPMNHRAGALVCPPNTPRSNCAAGTLPPAVNP